MAFDPTKPADASALSAAEMRAQFTALAGQIAALAARVAVLEGPGAAVLAVGEFGPAGVELSFSAVGATGFDIHQQQPGGALELVAAEVPGPSWTASGLSSGTHGFQVFGRNAAGVGPGSAVVEFTIA